MESFNIALAFLVGCIVSCIFFTIGRFIGKIEKESKDRDDRVQDLFDGIIHNNEDEYEQSFKNSFSDEMIIDAEYEDVVLDLQEYRKRKISQEENFDSLLGYEIMYHKKNNEYIKVPREIADLIKYLKKHT